MSVNNIMNNIDSAEKIAEQAINNCNYSLARKMVSDIAMMLSYVYDESTSQEQNRAFKNRERRLASLDKRLIDANQFWAD